MIICANVIGGCKGSTGPASLDPQTGKPYALSFPMVTIGDMVRAQKRLIEHLGIKCLLAVTGGSMGGMMALDWAVRYPDSVASVLAIATSARLTAQGIAFNEVGRQAIMADVNWQGGNYYGQTVPQAGLAVARMIGHITYLSEEQMHAKFGRRLQDRESFGYDFETEFQVESYLRYQGNRFVERFDANSYLYITKALDYFDLANGHRSLVEAFEKVQAEFLVVSFSSDWLYPTAESKEIVKALQANGVPTTFLEIPNAYGHDAFLLPSEELADLGQQLFGQRAAASARARDRGGLSMTQQRANTHQATRQPTKRRLDYELIEALVPRGARVLDLGCGDGQLLADLVERKGCQGRGIEINEQAVVACIRRGVAVYHGDMLEGMGFYGERSFDVVILSQTLQQTSDPVRVIQRDAARGRDGDHQLSQLWVLARAAAALAHRAHAQKPLAALCLVQHAQRAPVHGHRLSQAVRGTGAGTSARNFLGPTEPPDWPFAGQLAGESCHFPGTPGQRHPHRQGLTIWYLIVAHTREICYSWSSTITQESKEG